MFDELRLGHVNRQLAHIFYVITDAFDVFSDKHEPAKPDFRLNELNVPFFITRYPQLTQSAGPALAQLCG